MSVPLLYGTQYSASLSYTNTVQGHVSIPYWDAKSPAFSQFFFVSKPCYVIGVTVFNALVAFSMDM